MVLWRGTVTLLSFAVRSNLRLLTKNRHTHVSLSNTSKTAEVTTLQITDYLPTTRRHICFKKCRKEERPCQCYIYILWRCGPTRVMASSFFLRFRDHIQRRTTVARTPLNAWSARRRDLYMTTDKLPCPRWDSNSQSQQASGRRPTPYPARPVGSAVSVIFW